MDMLVDLNNIEIYVQKTHHCDSSNLVSFLLLYYLILSATLTNSSLVISGVLVLNVYSVD